MSASIDDDANARTSFLPMPYVLLPRELLTHPPIRTKHCTNPAAVTPFEFAVIASILVAARSQWSDDVHERSLERGAEQIAEEKQLDEQYRDQWRETNTRRKHGEDRSAPKRASTVHKPRYKSKLKADERFRRAGSTGYKQRRKTLAKNGPPDDVIVTLSRPNLLRLAGLPPNMFNRNRLNGAINRVIRPVGDLPPPVRSWRPTNDGLLQLCVSAKWLLPPFARVPMPLPVHKSPAALALFLFLNSGIKTSQFNKEGITIRFLFKKLGLSTAPRTYFLSRAVNRALAVINDHLDKLPVTAHLKVPVQYKFVAIGGGRIRFELIPRPYREDDDSDEPQTPARRAKTRRTAKTGRKSMEEPAPTPEPAPAPEPTPTLGEKPQPLTSEEVKQWAKSKRWRYTDQDADVTAEEERESHTRRRRRFARSIDIADY